VARLESHKPTWPLPKIFQLAKGGKLIDGIFKGDTINTPSMLATEDAIDGLRWAESIGGLDALIARSNANLIAIAAWADKTPWVDFLARDAATRSSTSVCLKLADPAFAKLDNAAALKLIDKLTGLLEAEGVAYDIASYRDAPPGLRIWAGATVERADLEALFPWLEWAYGEIKVPA
jgi:phosphoserine aminotransferase